MASIVMILGKTGTGKSTGIKTLDPKETVVFNVLKKRLPFKGSASLYNEQNKNMFNISEFDKIINYLQAVDKSAPHVKNIIIDDMIYIMRKEYFKTAKITGYNKFVDMASHFQSIISVAENMRDDITVFFILHSEDIVSDKTIVGYKAATIGSMIDNSYNPVEVVPTVLYSTVKYDENKKPIYGLYTHRCMEGSAEIPAKSPDGLFEEDFIPNDYGMIVKAMNEYYN